MLAATPLSTLQTMVAPPPPPGVTAGPATVGTITRSSDTIVKQVLEGLVYMVRGGEGLDIPEDARAQLKVVAARVIARLNTKVFPAITPQELRAVYTISAKTAPTVFNWMFFRRALRA